MNSELHPKPKKDPGRWTTGVEPRSGPQRFYLQMLGAAVHKPFDEPFSRAEASKRIDGLQEKASRGGPAPAVGEER